MIAFLAVVAVASGFYIEYREAQAQLVAHITSLDQIQGVSATLCTYQVGSYGTGSGGAMYIDDNEIRIIVDDLEAPGFSGGMQAVLGTDGTRLIDPVSKSHAVSDNVANVLNSLITEAPWSCEPWWFPNGSLFTLANGVSF